jgi:hypothetical protein
MRGLGADDLGPAAAREPDGDEENAAHDTGLRRRGDWHLK